MKHFFKIDKPAGLILIFFLPTRINNGPIFFFMQAPFLILKRIIFLKCLVCNNGKSSLPEILQNHRGGGKGIV